jgi:hypothetical protein
MNYFKKMWRKLYIGQKSLKSDQLCSIDKIYHVCDKTGNTVTDVILTHDGYSVEIKYPPNFTRACKENYKALRRAAYDSLNYKPKLKMHE